MKELMPYNGWQMSIKDILYKHYTETRNGGIIVLLRKLKSFLRVIFILLFSVLALPIVLLIRLIRPFYLIRFGTLFSSRIGHLAANTELYLCERDAGINQPQKRITDIFYLAYRPICNKQLVRMWKKVLNIWPSWILIPIVRINKLIPGGKIHEIGNNTQHDRDVHNLFDRFPPHLKFTNKEEVRGKAKLASMGITPEDQFICLIVRDNAYLNKHQPDGDWSYHDYRDCNIQNYVIASEALADCGYFVIRMGVFANEPIKTKNKKIIDYSFNGMRDDFMD
uniref:TIGR04372 family glycosyltransferase n=1 Tax=Algoriphagus sp. TaxID=1872435 RepID=UPI0040472DF9